MESLQRSEWEGGGATGFHVQRIHPISVLVGKELHCRKENDLRDKEGEKLKV